MYVTSCIWHHFCYVFSVTQKFSKIVTKFWICRKKTNRSNKWYLRFFEILFDSPAYFALFPQFAKILNARPKSDIIFGWWNRRISKSESILIPQIYARKLSFKLRGLTIAYSSSPSDSVDVITNLCVVFKLSYSQTTTEFLCINSIMAPYAPNRTFG